MECFSSALGRCCSALGRCLLAFCSALGRCWSSFKRCFTNDHEAPERDRTPLLPKRDGNEYQHVKDIEGEPTGKKWYHGRISNDEAEYRLEEGAEGNEGSYLVYDNPRVRGQYILLVYHKKKMLRWRIQRMASDGMYILGEDGPGVARYRTVKELIKTHRGVMGKPIKLEQGGVLTLSKSYVYTEGK